VWSVTETHTGDDLFEVADGWAAVVAGELGDYSGVVFRALHDAEPVPSSAEAAARLAFAHYMEVGSPESLAAAREAIERALEEGFRSSVLLAMAASALAVQVVDGYSQDLENLVLAERYAREALGLDPRSGHAHCALGTIALPRNQPELAVRHGRQAIACNPDHPTIVATAGMLVAYGGDWDEGIAIFRRGLELQPAHPGIWHAILAADRLMADDDAGALAEASMIPDAGVPWGYLHRSLALAGLGYLDRAHVEFEQVLRLVPDFLDDPYTSMGGNRLLSRERLAPLLERVQRIVADRRAREAQVSEELAEEQDGPRSMRTDG
jgi:tetratricopeptide (TPR) repeat protein